jgi:hypothetical protein
MSETATPAPKSSILEIVGFSLAMLLGFGGILLGEPCYPVVFIMAAAAGGSLIFLAYWGGRLDSAREFSALPDLPKPEERQTP